MTRSTPVPTDTLTEKEAGFLRPGDLLLTETWLPMDEGIMGFAFNRDRNLRHLIREANCPRHVRVISVDQVPDEPSDIALLLDFGVGTYCLELHRECLTQAYETTP